jgi:ribosomal-protein-alanine N-acetyltransferase
MCAEPESAPNLTRVARCPREELDQVREILEASPEASGWSRAALAAIHQQDPDHLLIGWRGPELAGFISGRVAADEGEILNLAVRERFRRQGVGKALLQTLLDLFVREHVRHVFLEVRESNRNAVSFYRSMGFREVGRRDGYYREPKEAALVLGLEDLSRAGTT